MNDNIMKILFFHNMIFDLKGHMRSNKALYVYLFNFSARIPLKGIGTVPSFALWM